MAIKVELNPETLAPERRRPGYALLRLSGWTHAPNDSVLAVQRNQDGKFLGLNGQWQPTPIWHPLHGMAFDQNGWLCGDVTPALVDPLVAEPNVVYRVEIKADGTKQQGVIRIASAVLASSAAGESAVLSETGAGFIATELPKTKVAVKADLAKVSKPEPASEPEPKPAPVSEPAPKSDSDSPKPPRRDEQARPRRLWPLITSIAVLVLLLGGAGAIWWLGWFPPSKNVVVDPVVNPIPDPDEKDEKLTDLELLQRFLKTNPASEQVLAQAEAWENDKHCEAMRRLMVHAAQKTSDANIAFAYAQKYDSATFQNRGCIAEADADSAAYWYEIPANTGNVQAQYRLGRLLTEMHRSGYQHDQGVEFLKKSAQAGHAEANLWLKKMGQ
ncbi:MAG: hypothetical protein ACRERU_02005 [Methylococcales bacterium]